MGVDRLTILLILLTDVVFLKSRIEFNKERSLVALLPKVYLSLNPSKSFSLSLSVLTYPIEKLLNTFFSMVILLIFLILVSSISKCFKSIFKPKIRFTEKLISCAFKLIKLFFLSVCLYDKYNLRTCVR